MPKLPPSRRVRSRRHRSGKAIAAANLEAQALEMKALGHTFRQIAEAAGVSKTAAEKAYYRALQAISESDAQEERSLQLARIGSMRRALWAQFSEAQDRCEHCGVSRAMLEAAAPLIRLEERQSRLLGLDQPIKVDVSLGAPKKIAVDRQSRAEALERLSIDQQRQLLLLLRLMRGEPPYPIGPFVESANGHATDNQPALNDSARQLIVQLKSGQRVVKEED